MTSGGLFSTGYPAYFKEAARRAADAEWPGLPMHSTADTLAAHVHI
jgi:hypothetical protein